MLIDWFTVIAQVVNFLILIWLLKRFLYQPVLKALDAREKRIAAELADADEKRAAAGAEREEYQRKNDEFDRQRAALLSKATDEAAAERRRLLDEARKDADALRAKLHDQLSSEYHGLHEEIARRTRAEVFAMARKALEDLAGASLEERMVEVFVSRLRALDITEKEGLAALLRSPEGQALVRSAFDLSPSQRALIEDALRETLAIEARIRFEVAPGLLSGVELTMQGRKVAWSIADYLASLEKGVSELLKAQPRPDASANRQDR